MKIKIKVIKQNGKCPRGFRIGDEFIIEEGKTPKGMCCSAFNSIWPLQELYWLLKIKNKNVVLFVLMEFWNLN